jgi:hypothetical protein
MQELKIDKSYQVEKLLLTNNCFKFLHNYLKYFYDDINNEFIRIIIAPTDDAISRLETTIGKTIDQIVSLDADINILDNHLSADNPKADPEIAYVAINNQSIKHEVIRKLKTIATVHIDQNLLVLIVDNIIYGNDQLTVLKNEPVNNVLPKR